MSFYVNTGHHAQDTSSRGAPGGAAAFSAAWGTGREGATPGKAAGKQWKPGGVVTGASQGQRKAPLP